MRKIVDVFEDQASMKPKSSAHSHKASTEDEKKILADLWKVKPFSPTLGRFHKSFVGISSDPLDNSDEGKFCAWLQIHQKYCSALSNTG